MPKNTLLFYSGIYDFTAEEFINQIKDIPNEEPLTVKLNSPGGSVFAAWGICGALAERKGENAVIVEGVAASMSFILTLFFDKVSALDVTSFMVHRASMYVSGEDDQKLLDKVNKDMRQKIEKRIDVEKFKEITGVSINDIFTSEKRRDVWITAKEAKEIGLVDKIIKLDTAQVKAYTERLVALANGEMEQKPKNNVDPDNNLNTNIQKPKVMDINTLKAEHIGVYNEAVEAGKKLGIEAEKNRVAAWLAWNPIVPEKVKAGIESGKDITPAETQEFVIAMNDPKKLEELRGNSAPKVETPKKEEEKTEEEKEVTAAQEELDKELGINQKNKEDK